MMPSVVIIRFVCVCVACCTEVVRLSSWQDYIHLKCIPRAEGLWCFGARTIPIWKDTFLKPFTTMMSFCESFVLLFVLLYCRGFAIIRLWPISNTAALQYYAIFCSFFFKVHPHSPINPGWHYVLVWLRGFSCINQKYCLRKSRNSFG